jgi:tripartite-type tricarboxylate transporter receptor subunit TctC
MRRLILGAAAVALWATAASAADWPERPVRLIVPFPPGGVTDNIARNSADWLSRRLGQNVIVENRPGASGAIAVELVAKAPADGYTLLMAPLPQMAILPAMTRTPYDPVKDFAPITIVGANVFGLAAHRSLPADTLPKLVSFVKARPGQVSYASAGSGTVSHLTMALFMQRAGLDMVHVPYKGGGLAVADTLAGHVALYFGNLSEAIPHAKSKRIRVLAVSGDTRASQLPDVPTVAESGYPGFRTSTWNGIAAPARTPQAIIGRIAREMRPAANDAAFTDKLQVIGVDAVCGTPEEFARTLKADTVIWAEAVRISGARIE